MQTCQLDYICEATTDKAKRIALRSLPPTLNASYERILRRANEKSKDIQKLVRNSLRWIVLHPGLLVRTPQLYHALSINDGDETFDEENLPDVDDILLWCSSLIRISVDRRALEPAHFTVKEFLLSLSSENDKDLGQHGLSDDGYRYFTQVSLTYLCLRDFDRPCPLTQQDFYDLMQEFPFYSTAATQWYVEEREHLESGTLLELVKHLFQPSKPNRFISWAIVYLVYDEFRNPRESGDLERELVIDRSIAASSQASPLHFAAFIQLPLLCQWLVDQNCDVNQASDLGQPIHCAMRPHNLWDKGKMYPFSDDPSKICGILDILLRAGAEVNAKCYTYYGPDTPLGIAFSWVSWDTRRHLTHAILPFLLGKGSTITRIQLPQLLQLIRCSTPEESQHILNHIRKENINTEGAAGILAEIDLASKSVRVTESHALYSGSLTHSLDLLRLT